MRVLILITLLCSNNLFAEFENKRIHYSDAAIKNQINIALKVLEWRYPLARITPMVETDYSQYATMGDFFVGQIKDHAEYQKANQDVLEQEKLEMEISPTTGISTTAEPIIPAISKSIKGYFQCLNDNFINLKRVTSLNRKNHLNAIEEQERNLLENKLDRTRGKNGFADIEANLCGIFLGKASFQKMTSLQTLKFIYGIQNLSDASREHLLTIYVAANHENMDLTRKDTWLFTAKYMTLRAYAKSASLPDRDQMLDDILIMRNKMQPASVTTAIGAGSETINYLLKNIEAEMLEDYDQAEKLVNDAN